MMKELHQSNGFRKDIAEVSVNGNAPTNLKESANGQPAVRVAGSSAATAPADKSTKTQDLDDEEVKTARCLCCLWGNRAISKSSGFAREMPVQCESYTVTADTVHVLTKQKQLEEANTSVDPSTCGAFQNVGANTIVQQVSVIYSSNSNNHIFDESATSRGAHHTSIFKTQPEQQGSFKAPSDILTQSFAGDSHTDQLSISGDASMVERWPRTLARAWSNPPEGSGGGGSFLPDPNSRAKWWERRAAPVHHRGRGDGEAASKRQSFLRQAARPSPAACGRHQSDRIPGATAPRKCRASRNRGLAAPGPSLPFRPSFAALAPFTFLRHPSSQPSSSAPPLYPAITSFPAPSPRSWHLPSCTSTSSRASRRAPGVHNSGRPRASRALGARQAWGVGPGLGRHYPQSRKGRPRPRGTPQQRERERERERERKREREREKERAIDR